MFKKLVIAVALTIAFTPTACFAQMDTGGGQGDQGIEHDTPSTPGNLTTENPWSDITNTNGDGAAREGGYGQNNGTAFQPLDLPGEPSPGGPDGGVGSGASTSMPILGTFVAPGNLALMNQRLRSLPETRLDSFVKESGYNDLIYGDEGTDTIPPYFTFTEAHRIERGIEASGNAGGLTTGHPSDAPDAWGWPN